MKFIRKIKSTKALASLVKRNARIVVGVSDLVRFQQRLIELGFTYPLVPGESLLPSSDFGKACSINAEGWVEIHKDRPKETCYRHIIWKWKMKRGWSYEWESKPVSVPYKRYPRTEHPPLGLELRIAPKVSGELLAVFDELEFNDGNDFRVKTAINSLVEIFGECTVFTSNLDEIIKAEIKRLNWRILPPGKQPWNKIEEAVEVLINKEPQKVREIILYRLEKINSFSPEFVALGTHGFSGYLVFGFPKKQLHLLESIYLGNATYGLGMNWESLCKLSKAELLNQNLHKFRVVHAEKWDRELGYHLR